MKIKTNKETNLQLTFGNVYSSGHSSFSNKKFYKWKIAKIKISFPFDDQEKKAFFWRVSLPALVRMLGISGSYRTQNIKQQISHLQASTVLFNYT